MSSAQQYDLARRRLADMPPAFSGQGGHRATFAAACMLARHGLDANDCMRLLQDIYNPMCKPRWSDRELAHKVRDALNKAGRKAGDIHTRQRREQPIRRSMSVAKSDELIRRFLGACTIQTGTPWFIITDWRRVQETLSDDEQTKLGLRSDKYPVCFVQHTLVIPWQDIEGRYTTFQRRGPDDTPSSHKYVFPPKLPPTQPWGANQLGPEHHTVALTEGARDAWALSVLLESQGTIEIAPLGIAGVNGWRDSFASPIGSRSVLVAYDADTSGDDAANNLMRRYPHWDRLRPKRCKDWMEELKRG